MRFTIRLESDVPEELAMLKALINYTGAPTTHAPMAPTAPAAAPAGIMPGMPSAPAPAAPSAPAAAPAGVMPGMPAPAPVPAPAAAAPGAMTREELIARMALAVKVAGPAATIQKLQQTVAGFTDVPSAPVEMYPAIAQALDSIAAGQ